MSLLSRLVPAALIAFLFAPPAPPRTPRRWTG